jgi:tryptophan synthase alpha subunit
VIVGSAFVRAVLDAPTPTDAMAAVGVLAAELARGVRGG